MISLSVLADKKGYWVKPNSLAINYSLYRLKPTEEQINNHIKKVNPMLSSDERVELASNIIRITKCFGIDPWVFTGLVDKESSFRAKVVSPTGAAGLTQFTSIALKEVNDQLGLRGREGAHYKNIQYLNDKVKYCVNEGWVELWDRVSVESDHPDFYVQLKEELKNDIEASIVYGSILLKIYLSRINDREGDKNLKKSSIYFEALKIYNGEEGDNKIIYAKDVMRNSIEAYPKDVQFSFLK